MTAADTPPPGPRTAAGQWLRDHRFGMEVEHDDEWVRRILAIEAEARAGLDVPLDGLVAELLHVENLLHDTRAALRKATDTLAGLANRPTEPAAYGGRDARCDHIVNDGTGEPTECGRTLPCEYHDGGRDEGLLDSDAFRAAVKSVFEAPGEWGPAQGYYQHYIDSFIDGLRAALRQQGEGQRG